ncbi:MAG: 6-phosphofructokinase [Bacteroidetes bacterium QS_8_64_10]|nr:MAG: 6-phosphofructokinase [Bacteroidetes bacterium QS_8_64_10]
MNDEIRCIGILTSGGDAPGMNACVRAAVRTALAQDLRVVGIRRGYEGLIEGDFVEMDGRSVSNIVQAGGTILKSARSPGMNDEHDTRIVGCPGTIDNDLFGTDDTIGYDTALNTAIDNIDRIRDTADAHDRLFLVEVMGRDAGFIALNSGIGGGAELVLIPETITQMSDIKDRIHSLMSAQSRSSIVVVAEGDEHGGATHIKEALQADDSFDNIDLRVCILGHTQRGGSPTARDRVLASRLGSAAIDALIEGHDTVMVGVVNKDIKLTPMRNVFGRKKNINYELLKLTQLLS